MDIHPSQASDVSIELPELKKPKVTQFYIVGAKFATTTHTSHANMDSPSINVTPAVQQQQQLIPLRAYRGRPENQRNPSAPNSWREPASNKNPKAFQSNRPQKPTGLNKPSQASNNVKPVLTSGNPADSSVFSAEVTVRETISRQLFSPSAPALIEISRQTYCEMVTEDSQLSKTILPEYLDYYATALLWLRITNLKQKNSQPLSGAENDLLMMSQTATFCVPEPITLQLKQLVRAITECIPTTPDGVLWPPVAGANADPTRHNLYEEIPCMGVLAEAVRASISDADPGLYPSELSQPDAVVNRNLLGFRPLGMRRAEAKNLAFSSEITPQAFPSYPANTGFCFPFLQAISNALSLTKTFKNTEIVFSTLSDIGEIKLFRKSVLYSVRPWTKFYSMK
ncbi:hypothetical protein JTB14_022465 [Gonioctena quinquepunctata]|nr:hypothetical protein JTB14_022465 [Gonioctena quinquepunctata]